MPHDQPSTPTILIAEDDPDDRFVAEHALRRNQLAKGVRFVEDGQELMDYLHRAGGCGKEGGQPPWPELILLDLNMPRKDGREALTEIRDDPELRRIPVVVLTTSRAEEDIARTYELGVNSVITKPDNFEELVEALRVVGQYWFSVVSLPQAKHRDRHGRASDSSAAD